MSERVDDLRVEAQTLEEMRELLEDLGSEARNRGEETENGKLLLRAYATLQWLLGLYFDPERV